MSQASVNKVEIIGNLAADPEIFSLSADARIATFTVVTNDRWKDKDGNKQEKAQFHRVSIRNEALIDVADKYLKKGSRIRLEGRLENRQWDDKQTGEKRYATEVVLRPFKGELQMLDAKPKAEPSRPSSSPYNKHSGPQPTA